jgi:predicted dehydrogenase
MVDTHAMTGEQTLGAAVVGTGFGVLTHVRALQAAGIEVRALVGRDAEKTASRAKLFGIPHPTTNRAEAFSRSDVDIVAVATPPHTHSAIVLDAVAAGKHVMCEKPFARDLDEAREMAAAAQTAGVVHMLGTEFRFGAGQGLLTRAVQSGQIGSPTFGLFLLQMPSLNDPKAELPDWWRDEGQGGGWLGAHGTHVIDQVRMTMGEIEAVSATLSTLSPLDMTADDTYSIQLHLADGATALLHSSCAMGGDFVVATKVIGTSGAAWLRGDEVWVDDGTGGRQLPAPEDLAPAPPSPPPSELLHTTYDMWHSMGIDLYPYTRLYGVMRDRILGLDVPVDPAPSTFVDGVANQAVVDAARLASRTRTWQNVSR